MDLDQRLARSAQLEARISDFLKLPLFDDSSRLRAVRAVASLGVEHTQSLKYLTAARLCTSAAALLRVQHESLARAIWMHHYPPIRKWSSCWPNWRMRRPNTQVRSDAQPHAVRDRGKSSLKIEWSAFKQCFGGQRSILVSSW